MRRPTGQLEAAAAETAGVSSLMGSPAAATAPPPVLLPSGNVIAAASVEDTDWQSVVDEQDASSSLGDHSQASLATLRQRVAALQHLAKEAERGRERAIAEACVLQQQRDFFQESTKEALSLVAALTERYISSAPRTD